MTVYELDTITNELLNTYESLTQASFNSEMSYRGIWNQCHRKKCGNGGFILTSTYFSFNPEGIAHNIILDGQGGAYTHIKEASEKTGVHPSTIRRHLKDKHTKFNVCGYKFSIEEVG